MTRAENEAWQALEILFEELCEQQRKTLLQCGRRIVPTLTPEDMLQPNDYPNLEVNPHFRYEEGVFAGLEAARIAVRALREDIDC